MFDLLSKVAYNENYCTGIRKWTVICETKLALNKKYIWNTANWPFHSRFNIIKFNCFYTVESIFYLSFVDLDQVLDPDLLLGLQHLNQKVEGQKKCRFQSIFHKHTIILSNWLIMLLVELVMFFFRVKLNILLVRLGLFFREA